MKDAPYYVKWRAANREKHRAYQAEWRAKNRERIRAQAKKKYNSSETKQAHRRRRYGISEEHFQQLLGQQKGLCAICQSNPATHVDHCHDTGKVRGLLCLKCNTGLGMFQDSGAELAKAIFYLNGKQT